MPRTTRHTPPIHTQYTSRARISHAPQRTLEHYTLQSRVTPTKRPLTLVDPGQLAHRAHFTPVRLCVAPLAYPLRTPCVPFTYPLRTPCVVPSCGALVWRPRVAPLPVTYQ